MRVGHATLSAMTSGSPSVKSVFPPPLAPIPPAPPDGPDEVPPEDEAPLPASPSPPSPPAPPLPLLKRSSPAPPQAMSINAQERKRSALWKGTAFGIRLSTRVAEDSRGGPKVRRTSTTLR